MAPKPGLTMIGPAMGFHSEVFEIESNKVGRKFEVSVTVPPGYVSGSRGYPILYATDTHTNIASMLAATLQVLTDSSRSTEPYILVCIGYVGEDTKSTILRRARELSPPGEPVPEVMKEHISHPRYNFTEDERRRLLESAHNGRADLFQAFIEEELHPEVMRRYGPFEDKAGFFGHSNGGLFALHLLLSSSVMFNRICAASPAIHTPESQVFSRYRALADLTPTRMDIDLFIPLAEFEMTGDFPLYRGLGINALSFIDLVKSCPMSGLNVASTIIPGENHASVVFEAFKRFIQHSYCKTG